MMSVGGRGAVGKNSQNTLMIRTGYYSYLYVFDLEEKNAVRNSQRGNS